MFYTLAAPEDLKGISFNCGNEYIDNYYKENKIFLDNDAVTYCFWTDESKRALVGIASLSCSGIIIKSKTQFYLEPAIEIKIFAVDEKYQHVTFPDEETNENWSDYCLFYLFEIIDDICTHCGAAHIVLYSVKQAEGFYKRHHFERFKELMERPSNREIDGCIPMFINL